MFHAPPADKPMDRMQLAQWLMARENPLTARVMSNRLWEALFGLGIVRTSEEFGSQGDLPSHPELLDWVAIRYMNLGWSSKRLLRELVLTNTYQQTSEVSSARLEADADNVWLARGARVRLSAEMVRDQALAAAGLLSHKMYGQPVRPPQPSLGLSAALAARPTGKPAWARIAIVVGSIRLGAARILIHRWQLSMRPAARFARCAAIAPIRPFKLS